MDSDLREAVESYHPLKGHVAMDTRELDVHQLLGVDGPVPIPMTS